MHPDYDLPSPARQTLDAPPLVDLGRTTVDRLVKLNDRLSRMVGALGVEPMGVPSAEGRSGLAGMFDATSQGLYTAEGYVSQMEAVLFGVDTAAKMRG